jgi:hypothetical protein
MKLLRCGLPGHEIPAVLDDSGRQRDLSRYVKDFAGTALLPDSLLQLRSIDPKTLPLIEGTPRIGACIPASGMSAKTSASV